ncbi:MAG TPA: response regulator [Tepidisphaeraceae bacterium]|nr:response regulator [Tepidisphaeraceae bacterium]
MSKILIVEDNEDNWQILSRRLRRRGYDVVVARNGKQGMDMAKTEKPDLILMDMNLPLVDGWEATRLLKKSNKTRHVPVVALTAHAMSGDRDKCIEAGCDDYHTKPVELTRLLEQIEALLAKRVEDLRAAQRAATGPAPSGEAQPTA